jgi:hypothetical protein
MIERRSENHRIDSIGTAGELFLSDLPLAARVSDSSLFAATTDTVPG